MDMMDSWIDDVLDEVFFFLSMTWKGDQGVSIDWLAVVDVRIECVLFESTTLCVLLF